MSLRTSYSLIAPIYDLALEGFSQQLRRNSLQRLGDVSDRSILIPGIGTGLDIPHLPTGARYTGLDLTPAMLARAQKRIRDDLALKLETGDAMSLPYAADSFDIVILHLILAVVPEPARVLQEAERVLKSGGRILILDKFLRLGERAPLRRLLSPLIGRLATRTDVVFEEVLQSCPDLQIQSDEPAALGGWFRHIELTKP